MYVALFLILAVLGGTLLARGVQNHRTGSVIAGSGILFAGVVFFWLLDFWGEMLWFHALGYGSRFWTVLFAQWGTALAGAGAGALAAFLLTLPIRAQRPFLRFVPVMGSALAGGIWGLVCWPRVLPYLYQVPTGIRDPILERDAAFYLFTLPFYDALYWGLFGIVAIAVAAALFSTAESAKAVHAGEVRSGEGDWRRMPVIYRRFWPLAIAVVGIVAWGQYLDIYHLMYSGSGAVTGAGWTDIHVRLPGHLITAGALIGGLIAFIPAVHERLVAWLRKRRLGLENAGLVALGVPWMGVLLVGFLSLGVAPAIVQWLLVEPNEITRESPYIAHNIDFTRRGFDLRKVEERQFPIGGKLTRQTVDDNRHVLSEVRLWDWRALDAVYKQFQEIRLYYEFVDVDVDRYRIHQDYRQVMVSAREIQPDNLPPESRTFVNRRFKYTHGYGLTITPVSEFTLDGRPDFLVKDIPPKTNVPALAVDRPQIYYGELTDSHVFVNTSEPEFDYPSGDENVTIRYPGEGGVEISSLWRKFLFGWKFDGSRFLFLTYPTSESRVLFHRQILERVKTLAPFLEFDRDPYIVLVDGELHWIIDAYTTSSYFPYSEPFSGTEVIETRQTERDRRLLGLSASSLAGSNYVRNSVKAVVDAFNGSVTFYVFEPEDPLIQVWQRIFPGLFVSEEEMLEAMRSHVRYPVDFLLTQGLVYAKYHMTDPEVFYNQEDLWVRATEKYYAELQPVEPYYVMWKPPGAKGRVQFSLILPFTPKKRQVLIGWIAGLSDGENYGRLLAYKFPKEQRILGPQQVETKIDQDSYLSAQLSLWNQRGSRVIRGNVLAIPIDSELLYVEPIYLQAEAAAYPELRLVVTMNEDNLSYAETFDKALEGLYREDGRREPSAPARGLVGAREPADELIPQANQAFKNYLRLQAEGRFTEAARELEKLQRALEQLSQQRN